MWQCGSCPFAHSLVITLKHDCCNRKFRQIIWWSSFASRIYGTGYDDHFRSLTVKLGRNLGEPFKTSVVVCWHPVLCFCMAMLILTMPEKLRNFWMNSNGMFFITPLTARTWRQMIFISSLTWRSSMYRSTLMMITNFKIPLKSWALSRILITQAAEFYDEGVCKLVKPHDKWLNLNGDYAEKWWQAVVVRCM